MYAKAGQSGSGHAEDEQAAKCKYEGELHYGKYSSFHDGVEAVLGHEIADEHTMGAIVREILEQGGSTDRYNLWYFLFCASVSQPNCDEKGKQRVMKGTAIPESDLDEGHDGMRLADFTRDVNDQLEGACSQKRVADANVLALRLYTSSTYKQLNGALRIKGKFSGASFVSEVKAQGTQELGFKACIQSARKCLLAMQAIKRPAVNTFRGATGYLGHEFEAEKIGMDFAFFSASTNQRVAAEFEGDVECSVLFEIQYLETCPGVDVSIVSVFPGENEVLYPPCTGLSLTGTAGKKNGHARVNVIPHSAS